MLFSLKENHADRTAVYSETGESVTYRMLEKAIQAYIDEKGLQTRGILLLECQNNLTTLITYLACLRSGCPVMLVGDGNTHAITGLLKHFPVRYVQYANGDFEQRDINCDLHPDLAVILSTSGSTGTKKAIRLSRANILENALSIAEYLQLTTKDCAPTTLPFQYSYGLSVINSHLVSGGTLWLTSYSVIEEAFWRGFSEHHCTSFAGVPHIYELINKANIDTAGLPSLRYTTQAGGRLRPELVEHFVYKSEREGWDFFVMYGQTEATARIAWLPPDKARDNLRCIGQPIPGGTLELYDERGDRVDENDVPGELVYCGPNVMMGYATQAGDFARAQEIDALHTGDLACRNVDGLFYIVGRKSRFIKVIGLRIGLDDIENRLAQKGINAAAVGADEHLHLYVTSEVDQEDLSTEVASWLKIPRDALSIDCIESLPRMENGKVNYAELNERSKHPEKTISDSLWVRLRRRFSRADRPDSIRHIFQNTFPGITLAPTDTFRDLGGDSLTYIKVSLEIERVLGVLPNGWENIPVQELESFKVQQSSWRTIESNTWLRFLAISLIVANHFEVFNYGGTGAYLLFMIAGYNFAQFQLRAIVDQQTPKPVLHLLVKVTGLTLGYLILLQAVFNSWDIRSLLLYSNYYDSTVAPRFAYWFIEVYVQLLLFIFVIFSIPMVRKLFRLREWDAALLLTVVMIISNIVVPLFWNTDSIYNRAPHFLGWMFFCGILAKVAPSRRAKIITTVLFVTTFVYNHADIFYRLLMFYGGLLLIWSPPLRIPAWLKLPIAEIAAASLFIYLTHTQFKSLTVHMLGDIAIVEMLVALIGGVICWRVVSFCMTWVELQWFANKSLTRTTADI